MDLSRSCPRIIIIGASYAGIKASHAILRQIPGAVVTLINLSDCFYFNIASPRIIAKPGAIDARRYLLPIKPYFARYPPEIFNFVKGRVTSIDIEERFVTVDADYTIPFNYLIIASGSTTASTLAHETTLAPWKPCRDDTLGNIEVSQRLIQEANSVVICGAGPVGLEFAGELAEISANEKRNRSIILVSATETLLPMLPHGVGSNAEKRLERKGVQIIKGNRVRSATRKEEGPWVITLADGTQILADCYISSTGVMPNNDFIPSEYLSDEGWVLVDEHLRVLGNSGTEAQPNGVFALGDITIHQPRIVRSIMEQVPVLVANLEADIAGVDAQSNTRTTYTPITLTSILIPLGSSDGTGLMMGMVLWGWIVWLIKGRNYLVPFVPWFLGR